MLAKEQLAADKENGSAAQRPRQMTVWLKSESPVNLS